MDYFSLIILIIVVFIFITDRKVKKIDVLQIEDENILLKIENIKQSLKIISLKEKQIEYSSLKDILKDVKEEYVIIKNNNLVLDENNINIIIANYISCKNRPCGFNLLYTYKGAKLSIKRVCVDIINYLNIFNKQDLKTYGVVISRKNDFENNEKDFKKTMLTYTWSELTNINIYEKQIKNINLNKLYIQKIKNSKFSIILKLMFLIISGSFITTNLVYAIFNIKNNIISFVLACVIYWCYIYILRYVYSPIGKKRIVASYVFPIYFLSYIFVGIYMLIYKVIKKIKMP